MEPYAGWCGTGELITPRARFAFWILSCAHGDYNPCHSTDQNRIPSDILIEEKKRNATTNDNHSNEESQQYGSESPDQCIAICAESGPYIRILRSFCHSDCPLGKSRQNTFVFAARIGRRDWPAKNLRSFDGQPANRWKDGSGNLLANKVSDLLALQKGRVALGCRWVGSALHGLLVKILSQDTPRLRENNPKPLALTHTQQKPAPKKRLGSENQRPACCLVHSSGVKIRTSRNGVKNARSSSFSVANSVINRPVGFAG